MFVASFTWFNLWLILHIFAVMIAFGPTFLFGVIAALGQKQPQHAAFAAEISDFLERRVTIPVAVVVPFFGLAMIFTAHFNLWKSEWLIISIILYTITFAFGVLVQNKNSGRMVRLLNSMPPGPPPPGAEPPADVIALGRKVQMGGMFLGLMILAILVLMVWRPGSCQGIC
jgi:Predicted integral membrane protein (DUF2269)